MNGAGVAATCGEDARTVETCRPARLATLLPSPSRTRLVYEGMPTQGRVSFARVARLFLPNLRSGQVVSLLALRSRSSQPLSDCAQRAQPPLSSKRRREPSLVRTIGRFDSALEVAPALLAPGSAARALAREGRRRAPETLRTRLRAWLDGQGSKRPRL